ncbi:class I SAM-dependent methyltransferase [Erysipelothrix aquatica]|uniref:class I SAM-dependent methyltransferase n=1 Tax=Erysipelothrix aquatica TaxID=2683714 RepID=UPI0022A67EEE|nr:class I SAM-dependent methyltransferase [Erysipelothrix aquatica]
MLMNHKQLAHLFMQKFLDETSNVVDMTAGNGHDTLFLAQHAKHVTAIDIQAEAIRSAQERTKEYHNITYLNQSHDLVDYALLAPITGVIYNLGFLPSSNKEIITTAATTIASLHRILPYVDKFIVVSCYLKHDGGYDEYLAVKNFVEALNKPYEVLEYETPLSPVTYLIDLSNSQ